ncbi:phospholipase D/nuclease [Panus rudis PR-1116 ss-1]|nr:phospholipase D/nuclease [Panus rudis PR-1116 ss-1]
MEGFDDEEIARAIALSMQESQEFKDKQTEHEVIEILSSDEEDERETFESSKGNRRVPHTTNSSNSNNISISSTPASSVTLDRVGSPQDSIPSGTPSASASTAPTISRNPLLFDRAQLERERLARQKRLRPDILQESSTSADAEHNKDEGRPEGSNKRQRLSYSSSSVRHANTPTSSTATFTGSSVSNGARENQNVASASTPQGGVFWNGELRQTANKHVDRDKDVRPTFRLSEILSPRDDISFAIISSFVVDIPWIYEFFKPSTPVVLVTQDAQGEETLKEVLPNWIKTTPALRGGRGCMHMKFMLLFYKTGRLRMVVSTANLVPYDWRDIENSVWLQDLPLRPQPISHDPKADDIGVAWARVLRAVNVQPALITLAKNGHESLPIIRPEDLRSKWDFSKVKVQLVASLSGRFESWPNVIRLGHTGLMKAIRDIGARTPSGKKLIIECQGSSIGTYSTQWMNEFYHSARGESAEDWLDQPKNRRSKLPYPPVKIIFPTLKTVQESVLGEEGGGTIFCRRNQWEAAKFPRGLFHDSRSRRGRVLMHSKMILGTFQDTGLGTSSGKQDVQPQSDSETEPESDDEVVELSAQGQGQAKPVGWLYIGSHNFTPSAWGTLSGSAFNPVLNATNYELGIVFPLRSKEEIDNVVCWERPPRKYANGQDVPWMQFDRD